MITQEGRHLANGSAVANNEGGDHPARGYRTVGCGVLLALAEVDGDNGTLRPFSVRKIASPRSGRGCA